MAIFATISPVFDAADPPRGVRGWRRPGRRDVPGHSRLGLTVLAPWVLDRVRRDGEQMAW